ncbi:hypothetical protein SDC9_175256 [bioreactor metagenome]|uniref:Uncharacterized protein n=1 Tax=bioreactor metagenome TaxID=1076179 RepID=A0A645GPI5_9ZZZZ
MCKRGFHEGFQTVCCTNGLCFGVIKRAQIAQGLEKFRRQNEREEAGSQCDTCAVVSKIEFAKVGKTEVNRDQCDGQGGKELKDTG